MSAIGCGTCSGSSIFLPRLIERRQGNWFEINLASCAHLLFAVLLFADAKSQRKPSHILYQRKNINFSQNELGEKLPRLIAYLRTKMLGNSKIDLACCMLFSVYVSNVIKSLHSNLYMYTGTVYNALAHIYTRSQTLQGEVALILLRYTRTSGDHNKIIIFYV